MRVRGRGSGFRGLSGANQEAGDSVEALFAQGGEAHGFLFAFVEPVDDPLFVRAGLDQVVEGVDVDVVGAVGGFVAGGVVGVPVVKEDLAEGGSSCVEVSHVIRSFSWRRT